MLVHNAMSLLALHTSLSASEQQAMENVCGAPRRYPARHSLLRAGDSPPGLFLILRGVACRFATLPGGHSQSYAYLLPGDIVGMRALVGLTMDHSVRALTPLDVALMPKESVSALVNEYPNISKALLRFSQIEAAMSRQWLLNVGHRSAFTALAHLFCEIFLRLQAAGLTQDNSGPLPLTQTDLAEALALSPVHLNRTLMKMRRAGVATLTGGKLCILNRDALWAAAKFDAQYLGGPGIPPSVLPAETGPLPPRLTEPRPFAPPPSVETPHLPRSTGPR